MAADDHASFRDERVSPGSETTKAKKGTLMNSTTVVGTDTTGRTLWVNIGWPACDERLVTVAETNTHRVGDATTQLPRRAVSRRKK